MRIEEKYWSEEISSVEGFAFDLDGTLVPTMELNYCCWQEVLTRFGYTLPRDQYFLREGEELGSLIGDLAVSDTPLGRQLDIEEVILLKDRLFSKLYKPEFYPGVNELLNSSRIASSRIALVTAARKERIEKMFSKEFLSHFDIIISRESTVRGKPFPEPYQAAAVGLDLPLKDIIAVENAPLGVKSARAAGLKCVGIASTLEPSILTEAGANPIFKDFKTFVKEFIK